jgi:nucleotidyltransferase substrate binding protein (TIGR01987 family)
MDEVNFKLQNFKKALESFRLALADYDNFQNVMPTLNVTSFDPERMLISLRDSMVQRFEYTLEVMWKYLKYHLEHNEKALKDISSPRVVIKTACHYGIISEVEAENFFRMIESRNMTSHIYKEEVAQLLSSQLPGFYILMVTLKDRLAKL